MSSAKPNNVNTCRYLIFQIFLFPIVFALFPLYTMLSLPFLALRQVVILSAKLFRKDLGKMLPTMSTFFAIDGVYENPKCNVSCTFVIEGTVDSSKARSSFNDFFKSLLKDSNGNDRYQELKQYLVQWFGYYFWKTDPCFDPDNHLSCLQEDIQHTERDLRRVWQDLMERNWPLSKPMWKVILVPKYTPTYSKKQGN